MKQSKCHLPFPLKVVRTVIMLGSFYVFYVLVLLSEVRAHDDISDWHSGEPRHLTAKRVANRFRACFSGVSISEA